MYIYACIIKLCLYPSVCQSIHFPVWHQPSVCLPSNLSCKTETHQHVVGHKETVVSFSLWRHRNNPPYSNIWWHRKLLHRNKKHLRGKTVSIYSKRGKKKERKKTGTWEEIADGLCYLCGCLYRGLGVLVSGEVRQNDLHGVVMSYRPALKAQAGRAATHRQRKWV